MSEHSDGPCIRHCSNVCVRVYAAAPIPPFTDVVYHDVQP